ncbi:amino acid ABC transporter permease [Paramicrobacterium agarici]|uniref:Polar amino acid transport system permease protein n=1 Tax=Paramicrobacterium agarici TaxID=630514 RepID=A0A2A9DTI7_9MICO|nr:amino acid ABC transporter permease [Microbacterium agarici]PFG29913.1 polar amino acid transport system permease protein [Microbacterium agarici]
MSSWEQIWEFRGLLLEGFFATFVLTVVSILTSTVLGFLVGLGRYARVPILGLLLRIYLEVFRGTPLLVQLLFIYFGAAYLQLEGITVFIAALIGMTLYQGAYISEIFRAGFESVNAGQREAATTLGMSRLSIIKNVVFPQTLPVVLAPLFGQYLTLVKNTALASVISYYDIVRQGQVIINHGANSFDVYLVVAAMFFIISFPLSLAARALEKRSVTRRERIA